ncbi:MAG TPA: dihydrofolate reductase family protein [Cyclobacteriaceae bacterium]|nr:dihydrofolate reductase family protein [Cyclobacteriaceae bacterium]
MRKVIATINMTLDGFCDHTAVDPDEEIHRHYQELLEAMDTIVYGRITFQLMQFWEDLVKNPSGDESMDAFARAIDNVPDKVVFSRTLDHVGWRNSRIAQKSLQDELDELRKQQGRDILIGSRSLIVQSLNLRLIDELQLCIHPVIAGSGLPLFSEIDDKTHLNLTTTKTFRSGAVVCYYEPM